MNPVSVYRIIRLMQEAIPSMPSVEIHFSPARQISWLQELVSVSSSTPAYAAPDLSPPFQRLQPCLLPPVFSVASESCDFL